MVFDLWCPMISGFCRSMRSRQSMAMASHRWGCQCLTAPTFILALGQRLAALGRRGVLATPVGGIRLLGSLACFAFSSPCRCFSLGSDFCSFGGRKLVEYLLSHRGHSPHIFRRIAWSYLFLIFFEASTFSRLPSLSCLYPLEVFFFDFLLVSGTLPELQVLLKTYWLGSPFTSYSLDLSPKL